MRIAFLEPANFGQQGDHIYRTAQPCRALCRAGPELRTLSGNWLSPAMRAAALASDVLVLAKVAEPDLLWMLDERRRLSRTTVYEIADDFTDVQPWNTTAAFYAQPENQSLVYQLARLCDGLQLSSHGLADKFGALHPKHLLVPNQIEQLPEPRRPNNPSRVMIGWGGSYGHRDDLAPVLPALEAVMRARPQVTLAIMGDPRLRGLFKWAPRKRFKFTGPGPLADYRRFLRGLDIGIAPLLPTDFNRGRSDVKFLEYAAHGVVPVCAADGPYATTVEDGATGFLFDGPEQLEARLLALVDAPALRARIADGAHAYVGEHRMQAAHVPALLNFYRGLTETPPRGDADAFDAVWANGQPDSNAASYHVCVPTQAEQHLYNGLLSQADPARAEKDLQASLRLDAGNYLTHLHLARVVVASDADAHFETAARLAPHSASVHFLRGLAALQASNGDEARQHLDACHARYAPARTRLAALLARQGDVAGARRAYTHALTENPHYGVAALGLAALELQLGDTAAATETLKAHRSACEADYRYWLMRGQLALKERHADTAIEVLERAEALAGQHTDQVRPQLAKAYAIAGRTADARAMLAKLQARQAS